MVATGSMKVLSRIYLFKDSNENTKRICDISSNLTIKALERRVNSGVSIVYLEQVNAAWGI